MKTVQAVVVVALVLVTASLSFASGLGQLRISYIKGDVQVRTPEAEEWGLAAVNAPLLEGDQVWVPPGGRAELQLNGRSYLRLDSDSSLQVLSLDNDSSQFYLAQGRVYAYFDPAEGALLQIDTPDASTRSFDKAVFRIDLGDDFSDVAVYKGAVDAENRAGHTRIRAGEMLSLGEYSEGEVAPMGAPDDWEVWNKSRNKRIYAGGGKSGAYLPEELRPYAPDLDSGGRWVYVQEYGNVWTPTVVVGTEWSPYREGRWIWRGGEYVWIGYEPWGWVPYHYGRWAFVNRVGWCWVPPARRAVYGGPGYVGWVTTHDHVAWVPLAPGEVYYGRGYYGPHSVNITNVNVTVTHVYRNVHVHNGVTVVRRNSFASAAPTRVRADRSFVRNNLLTERRLRPGSPDIRPSREAALLSGRRAPQAQLPPQRVRSLEVQTLKRERPLVRERGRAVLAPDATRALPVRSVETPRAAGRGTRALSRAGVPAVTAPAQEVRPPERRRPESQGRSVPVQPRREGVERQERAPADPRHTPGGWQGRERTQQRETPPAPPAATVNPPVAPAAPREGMPQRRVRPQAPAAVPQGVPSAAPETVRPAAPPPPQGSPRSRGRQQSPAEISTPAAPPAAAPATPALRQQEYRRHSQHPPRPVETAAPRPAERATPATPPAVTPSVPADRGGEGRGGGGERRRPAAVQPAVPAASTPAAPTAPPGQMERGRDR